MYNEECNGMSYRAIQHLADELAMKNMIDLIKWEGMFEDHELDIIIKAIKTHALMNAQMMVDKASKGVYSLNEELYEEYEKRELSKKNF